VFTYPSVYTCVDAQFQVNAIATVQNLRRLPTPPYATVPLSHFGGVFFALANRSDITSVADLPGLRLEGADLTNLGVCARLHACSPRVSPCADVCRCRAAHTRT
jgi:hypothetical protein